MFVLQEWVAEVGCKMQSILLSGFRAPDQETKAVKKYVRWLRGLCQINADPSKESYMQTVEMSHELIDAAIDELEYCPVHYVHHLADSSAVVAYHHPNDDMANFAYYMHEQVAVELFHFKPESMEEFLERHKDKFDSRPICDACFHDIVGESFQCGHCHALLCIACHSTQSHTCSEKLT